MTWYPRILVSDTVGLWIVSQSVYHQRAIYKRLGNQILIMYHKVHQCSDESHELIKRKEVTKKRRVNHQFYRILIYLYKLTLVSLRKERQDEKQQFGTNIPGHPTNGLSRLTSGSLRETHRTCSVDLSRLPRRTFLNRRLSYSLQEEDLHPTY